MVNYMNREIQKKLDEVIDAIQQTNSYQMCIKIKKKMYKNEELIQKIETLKRLQKQYVQSHFEDSKLKEELSSIEQELMNIPIYSEYLNHLEIVNQMIDTMKEELNTYFMEKVNLLK